MKRRLLLVGVFLALAALIWTFWPPTSAPVTAQFSHRTNNPAGIRLYVLAVTNTGSAEITVYHVWEGIGPLPGYTNAPRWSHYLHYAYPLAPGTGRLVACPSPDDNPRQALFQYNTRNNLAAFYRQVREWIRSRRWVEREQFPSGHALLLEVPPE